ncbi:MAG: disulfide bond formation protein B [Gammaproteobacteria bacterium]|nr:disulfide bond formation protein B [Gammaproteobacteria bacterium]
MMKLNSRTIQRVVLVLSSVYLLFSCYLQYAKGLSPCPLCIMQRVCMTGLLLTTVLALVQKKSVESSTLLMIQISWLLGGLFFAGRQLWLQSLPPEAVASCMPGLDILMAYFSWSDVMKALLLGGSDCVAVTMRIAGLSLAACSFLYFLTIFGCVAVIGFKKVR